jgi:hypothetical protein
VVSPAPVVDVLPAAGAPHPASLITSSPAAPDVITCSPPSPTVALPMGSTVRSAPTVAAAVPGVHRTALRHTRVAPAGTGVDARVDAAGTEQEAPLHVPAPVPAPTEPAPAAPAPAPSSSAFCGGSSASGGSSHARYGFLLVVRDSAQDAHAAGWSLLVSQEGSDEAHTAVADRGFRPD